MSSTESPENKSLVALFPQAATGNSYLQQIKALLQAEPTLHLLEAESSNEISEQLQKFNRGLVIFCVRDKEDLTVVLNGLAQWNGAIRSKFLRVIGVCQLNHPQIPTLLMKRGCADLFTANLNQKALRHKINQSLKILETYYSQNVGKNPLPPISDAPGKAATSTDAQENASSNLLKVLPPIQLASDCWLVRKDKDVRRVQGRWIVDLIGPGPSAGIWDEYPKQAGVWEWKPKITAESKEFVTDEGCWIFRGRKPEFVWDIGRWRFLGDQPEMLFIQGDQTLATRFKLVNGTMEYAENSAQARAKLPSIIKSIENEVHFKNEQKAKAAEKSAFKNEEEKPAAARDYQDTGDAKGGVSEPNVHDLTPDKDPEHSGGFALKGEIEETPFNQAPKPKLRIWVAPAQTGAGKPVEANAIEFSEKEFVLEVPAAMFSSGEAVILVMDDGLMAPGSRQRIKATLKQILSSEGETETVAILVDPSMKISLGPIQKALEERQQEVLNFLKAARGW